MTTPGLHGLAALAVAATLLLTPAMAEKGGHPEAATRTLPEAGSFIVERGPETMRGGKLGAVPVFDSGGEQVGDVEGTVLGFDGEVVALIVGVGGVLGLNEKLVAVRYGNVRAERTSEDELRFVVDLERVDLEAAPAFEPKDE